MHKQHHYQISGITMAVNAFILLGIAVAAVSYQRIWLGSISLFGFGVNIFGSLICWRDCCKC